MAHPGKMVTIRVDAGQTFQKIDGFGVNINAKYWNDGKLIPTLELLLNDLGATLYRVDIWGKSNWVDPTSAIGRASLRPERQAQIFSGEIFKRGWDLMRWLNEKHIQPYLTASGIMPKWMLGGDVKTLVDTDSFADMMTSLVDWAVNNEKIDFNLFSPLNEPDLGVPEGPKLSPVEYVMACEKLAEKLEQRGLRQIKLVVAEQAQFTPNYVQNLTRSAKLRGRIGAFAMHSYSDLSSDDFSQVTNIVRTSPYTNVPIWMTEYGDLEQSGEREWYVAWAMTSRLLDLLENGLNGALAWDAFDNYHDHDESWTIYGLLRTGLRVYTPKKRYYATKQIFRYVRPGFERISASSDTPGLRVLAFANPDRSQITVVGQNDTDKPTRLNLDLSNCTGLTETTTLSYYRTSETENCVNVEQVALHGPHWPFTGVDVMIPPASIFTLTNVK